MALEFADFSDENPEGLIDLITARSIKFIALVGIFINMITYFALSDSLYIFPRLFPPAMELFFIGLIIWGNEIKLKFKLKLLIASLFITGCYLLILGLLDMASLWFVLSIIYALFLTNGKEALYLFFASLVTVVSAGLAIMSKSTIIPLKYNFEPCQFACVSVRILHFFMIGSLVYYILTVFFSEIREKVHRLRRQSEDLQAINSALQKETDEKNHARQRLTDAMIISEENERKRLSADLHDGLGPTLSAIKLFFQAFVDSEKTDEKANIAEKLNNAIDSAIHETSRIAQNISPHILEQYGLEKAIRVFTEKIFENNGIAFKFNFEFNERFELSKELALYRIISELIHNSFKHSRASTVKIDCRNSENLIIIDYSDDGCGFFPESKSDKGMGIANMQNRVNSLGGTILIESSISNGMSARITIPGGKICQ